MKNENATKSSKFVLLKHLLLVNDGNGVHFTSFTLTFSLSLFVYMCVPSHLMCLFQVIWKTKWFSPLTYVLGNNVHNTHNIFQQSSQNNGIFVPVLSLFLSLFIHRVNVNVNGKFVAVSSQQKQLKLSRVCMSVRAPKRTSIEDT